MNAIHPPRFRSLIKRWAVELYCRGYLPAWVVVKIFRWLHLYSI